jgi:SpoVK/Ycf46/Vps4 family AAA+-type ATPase
LNPFANTFSAQPSREFSYVAGGTCIGWHSEHINEAGVIHLWVTSQVAEFLLAFRKLLQQHVARETLVLSRVKIEDAEASDDWKTITKDFEPLKDESIAPRVFDRVAADFVEPWNVGTSEKNYSMLLYGPPGTGKTKIAKHIANALGFRLITVTVSDFLGAGGALVEARAKAIFQMLQAQSSCIILFDEIDAFLLDRDSDYYRRQDSG